MKAIIHTNSRVIRRLTTDVTPEVSIDETVVDLPAAIDLSGGFWKLDATNQKVAATPLNVIDAGLNESAIAADARQRMLDLRAAAIAMRDDPLLSPTVREFALRFLQAGKLLV